MAVEWCGEQIVNWLRFVPRDTTPDWLESATRFEEESGLRMTGQFILDRGEYIQSMRGQVEASGRAAEWVILVTSTMRSVTIGCADHSGSQAPSFSFVAAPDHEISNVNFGPDGSICGFYQRKPE